MNTATLSAEDLQPGGVVDAVEAAGSATWSRHRISSLIFHRKTGLVYALSPRAGDPVFPRKQNASPKVLPEMADVFGNNRYATELGKLFTLVQVPAANLPGSELRTLPVSKDYVLNLLDDHEVRVRAVRRGHTTRQNRDAFGYRGSRGFVTADMLNVTVDTDGDDKAQILRVAEVRGRGSRRSLPGEIGTPVVSRNRALIGFVIGHANGRALVLPAEDVARELDIDFIAPEAVDNPVRYLPEVRNAAE